eukprot:CAMPEP_0113299196 /NCGR_PEP_ID=MMETSP0010_2-20120614/1327_1 /TAXON_ID=216773 ORGANISM="Corethron hystrix, Strain 308" /NCGR_SAMPLE_ID=MMETSP0010_2 /ASSEMBLY_ACC=CAM_ASM_000155 /LENGTH=108 /DNA_ID=CAMNT_0000152381 /DNA_START=196 /DNA_END=522 /DNA_ORIENTATION=+ /assembly_acc=CAM_ASM_000155
MDPNFRLFMTALPHPEFPLGLLQMCTKVTNEPPAGLRAGLLRSYTPGVVGDQEKIERVETPGTWRGSFSEPAIVRPSRRAVVRTSRPTERKESELPIRDIFLTFNSLG